MVQEPAASTIGATAGKIQFAGAGGAVASGLLSSEMGILAGIVIGVIGGIVSWYYKRKKDKREEEIHALKMDRLRNGDEIPPEAGSTLS